MHNHSECAGSSSCICRNPTYLNLPDFSKFEFPPVWAVQALHRFLQGSLMHRQHSEFGGQILLPPSPILVLSSLLLTFFREDCSLTTKRHSKHAKVFYDELPFSPFAVSAQSTALSSLHRPLQGRPHRKVAWDYWNQQKLTKRYQGSIWSRQRISLREKMLAQSVPCLVKI